jgi:hypothetical protein
LNDDETNPILTRGSDASLVAVSGNDFNGRNKADFFNLGTPSARLAAGRPGKSLS